MSCVSERTHALAQFRKEITLSATLSCGLISRCIVSSSLEHEHEVLDVVNYDVTLLVP